MHPFSSSYSITSLLSCTRIVILTFGKEVRTIEQTCSMWEKDINDQSDGSKFVIDSFSNRVEERRVAKTAYSTCSLLIKDFGFLLFSLMGSGIDSSLSDETGGRQIRF